MSLTVNLCSRKTGELKHFLDSYYCSDVEMNEETGDWVCVYDKPLEAVDLISAVMDNNDKYQIIIFIQINEGQLHHVTVDNYNSIIKDIFLLFYNENVMSYN